MTNIFTILFFLLFKCFLKFQAVSNIRKAEFYIVLTSRTRRPLLLVFSFFTHFLNLSNLIGDDLTYLTSFLMLAIDECRSFYSLGTIRLIMCAQKRTCKNWPSCKQPFQLHSFFVKSSTIRRSIISCDNKNTSYTPIMQARLITFPITSSLWLGIWQKLRILFWYF